MILMLIQCEIITHDHTLEKGGISSNKIIQKKAIAMLLNYLDLLS